MPDQSASVRRHLWIAQLIAYLLIVALGYAGFQMIRARAYEHRQVTASAVCGVYRLAVDLSTPPAGRHLTAEEKAYVSRTLARLREFRDEQLERLGVPTPKEC